MVEDDVISSAKRSGIIGNDENFYGSQKVLADNKERVFALAKYLKETKGISSVIIYGEICGGKYEHPEVEKIQGAVCVQKGIQYGPSNYFYAFDIRTSDGEFMNVLERNALFEKFGFLYAKPLFQGTLQECLDYPNAYDDPISGWLGLPKIEGNTCEGNVIKPLETKRLPDGERVILKNKNERWSEKTKAPKVKTEVVLSEEGTRLHNEILSFLSENRLKNVLSKIGPVQQNEFGKIISALSEDLWKDALKDNRDAWEALPAEESKKISKSVGQEVAGLIRKHFVNIVDGRFLEINKMEKLDKLVAKGLIKSYTILNVDEDGNVGQRSQSRNTEQLRMVFPNGEMMTIDTFCSGCLEDTIIMVS
jgi:Rnl2 family RNA ligase